MKVFLLSCLAAIVITVAANVILNRALPLSSAQAYTVGDNVRIGDAGGALTEAD